MTDFTKGMRVFLAMGDLTASERTLEDKVAYEERIVFATMRASIPEWQPPSNWESLSLEEKDRRLTLLKSL